ncbi:MAG TPA: response regulator [Dehalococcoidia bacterium]|jgi:CheY-like chemotaxis protein|nr:response regulator [Dehalococcoidia bacterium]
MASQRAGVLIVDDERSVTDLLSTALEEDGYSCITAATGEDALQKLSVGNVDVTLLDLRLPGISGMDVLRVIKSTYPRTAVIVVTALGDAETAVEAMKIGAMDYITKPFELERISHSVEAALQAATTWAREPAACGEDVETDDEAGWMRYLDDIARGVEARLDWLTDHVMTRIVVERTTAIARGLGIPESQIERWADSVLGRIKRVNVMGAFLEKLEQTHAT